MYEFILTTLLNSKLLVLSVLICLTMIPAIYNLLKRTVITRNTTCRLALGLVFVGLLF